MDRRGFLIAAAGAATLPVVGRLLGRAAAAGSVMPPLGLSDAQQAGAELSLEMLTHRPLNAQTPFAAMRSWRTPNDLFYVRSHFGAPAQVPEQWTLTIDGEVERPLTLTLEDTKVFRRDSTRCARVCGQRDPIADRLHSSQHSSVGPRRPRVRLHDTSQRGCSADLISM